MTSRTVNRGESRPSWAATAVLRFSALLLGLSSCSGDVGAPDAAAIRGSTFFDTLAAGGTDAIVQVEAANLDLGSVDSAGEAQDAALPPVADSGPDADTAGADVEAGLASFTALPSLNTRRASHSTTVLSDGRVLIVGGQYGVYSPGKGRVEPVRTNSAELYDPATETFTPTGSLAATRLDHTATLLPDGKVLIAGGRADILPSTSAELYDPVTSTFQPTGTLLTARAGHTATVLGNGKVFMAGGDTASCELYDPATGSYAATGSMASARRAHTATLLESGKVLIVGGTASFSTAGFVTAEIYDPSTGTFAPTGPLSTMRDAHSATRLADGRVLIAGGERDASTSDATCFASAEVYDPATGTFTPTGSMYTERLDHTATLLANGKVLVAGGWKSVSATSGDYPATAELYDPATGTFTTTGTLVSGRSGHRAVVLATGKVLLVGGVGGDNMAELYDPATGTFHSRALARQGHTATLLANGKVLFSAAAPDPSSNTPVSAPAVLYDPVARLFTATGQMVRSRSCHTSTLLPNNKVLFAGGSAPGSALDTVELYDPDAGTFSATATMTPRCGHTATLLADGRVFIAGGAGQETSTEIFDVATATFTASGSMSSGRSNHTATLLPNGMVLLVGGWSTTSATLASAQIYDPATGSLADTGALATGRIGHTATLLPDGRVLVVGGWSGSFSASTGLYAGVTVATAELYSVTTGSFSTAGSLSTARLYHAAARLPDGEVLVVGGSYSLPPAQTSGEPPPLSSAELYDPATGSFSPGPSLTMRRVGPTATLMTNGEVLVVGGNAAGYHGHETVAQVELYH